MHISKLTLVNFRNFHRSNLYFEKGINTILGENGSGKTNLFRAIRLLLDDSIYQSAFKLDESDFNRKVEDWRGHWIIISVEFSEISNDEAVQALFIHNSGNISDTDEVTKATYTLFFRPKEPIRKKLAGLQPGDNDLLKSILSTINIKDDYETVFTGKSTVDFTDPNVYKELVGDFKQVNFSNETDTSKYGVKIPHQLSISKEISFTFIKALRDVVTDFYNNRSNPLLNLLKFKSGEISQDEFTPIADQIRDLNSKIESLDEIVAIQKDVKSTIRDAVGETYAPTALTIKSGLSDDASKLLQSLNLFIAEPSEDHEAPIHEMSLGGANLIFLTLKLLEYKYNKAKNPIANFLLIEEPEAHIHTHIQKTLFDKINFEDTQIIYSTHSPQISEVSRISKMNILSKRKNYTEVFRPSSGLNKKQVTRVERYLDAIRSNLLFAKGVILVEGDAEEILIPTLVKKVFGVTLDELGVSLINIRSTGFENISVLFHRDRIGNRCSIVTDLDAPYFDISPVEGDSESLKTQKKSMANAFKLGSERKNKLDGYFNENGLVKAFYAKHTFEVDFISDNNGSTIAQILPSIYSNQTKIEAVTKELESEDLAIAGNSMLALAKKVGKGWFATLLCEQISNSTRIPNYIIQAVAFACARVNRDIVRRMIRFRIDVHSGLEAEPDLSVIRSAIDADFGENNLNENIIKELRNILPDEQILIFINELDA